MGFLLPRFTSGAVTSNVDTPLVWRGLMVQKAVQQLLFDVDWRAGSASSGTCFEYHVALVLQLRMLIDVIQHQARGWTSSLLTCLQELATCI